MDGRSIQSNIPMRIRLLFAIVTLAAAQQQPASLTPADAAVVMDGVWQARRMVLEDTTAINYCDVSTFFDSNGQIMPAQEKRGIRYRTRRECSERRAEGESRRVVIEGHGVRGDTITLFGRTYRPDAQIVEAYRFIRIAGRPVFREYRTIAIVQH